MKPRRIPLTASGWTVAVLGVVAYVGGWLLGWVELMVVAAGCLIALIVALPFVIAAGLYFGGWQPTRSVAHGQLLTPPPALPAGGLVDVAGGAVATADLHGKWLLVLSLDGPCGADCAARLDSSLEGARARRA